MVAMLKMRSFAYFLIATLIEHGAHIHNIEHQVLEVFKIIPMVIVDLEIITTILQTKNELKP
jgi:hypothetical protein